MSTTGFLCDVSERLSEADEARHHCCRTFRAFESLIREEVTAAIGDLEDYGWFYFAGEER
jgi:hypothetical protein